MHRIIRTRVAFKADVVMVALNVAVTILIEADGGATGVAVAAVDIKAEL